MNQMHWLSTPAPLLNFGTPVYCPTWGLHFLSPPIHTLQRCLPALPKRIWDLTVSQQLEKSHWRLYKVWPTGEGDALPSRKLGSESEVWQRRYIKSHLVISIISLTPVWHTYSLPFHSCTKSMGSSFQRRGSLRWTQTVGTPAWQPPSIAIVGEMLMTTEDNNGSTGLCSTYSNILKALISLLSHHLPLYRWGN